MDKWPRFEQEAGKPGFGTLHGGVITVHEGTCSTSARRRPGTNMEITVEDIGALAQNSA